jgi:hypothetical protein
MKFPAIVFILAATVFAGPVSHFGMLEVCGNNICGKITGTSTPILLKGPSLYWSDGTGSPFYNAETVDWFVDNMQIGIIRAAMGIRYYGNNTGTIDASGGVHGYHFDSTTQKRLIRDVINAAIINDIYVIVDWHSHNAHEGQEPAQSRSFFRQMATEFKDVPNIIWEVYNEPISANAGQITSYANSVITEIRNAGSNNLVLVGSRNWSQNPSEQASNFGNTASSKNVAFTFHFYAAEGGGGGHDNVMSSANSARSAGYAVFGSEWGFTEANGTGSLNQGSKWTSWMDNNNISNCNWSVSNIENSSMFTAGTSAANLSTSRLRQSGQYFQTYMNSNKWTAKIPSNHPKGNDVSVSVKDGESVTIPTASLGLTGNITAVSQPSSGSAEFTANTLKYTTSPSGSPTEKVRFTYKITQGSITVQRRVTVTVTNRRPILPQKSPIAVSRRVPTRFSMVNAFSPTDPSGGTLSFKEVSLSNTSVGTISITSGKDSLVFTPSASMRDAAPTEVTLNYSIQNASGIFSSASVVLQVQNIQPSININNICCLGSKPNTEPIGIGMANVGAQDRDGDSIWFVALYLDPQYPGSLRQVKPDSFVYTPVNNRTGKVVFLAVITDGNLNSVLGKTNLTLTGSGTEINVTAPTEIPGVVPIISQPSIGSFGMSSLGSGDILLHFSQSDFAKLEVYSLSGRNMGTLLNSWQNAGSARVSLKSLNLQKGVYILRLKQGSQVKTLRIVN